MDASSKVIVLDPDARAGKQLRLGFEREGLTAVTELEPTGASLVVVGGVDGAGLELVKKARAAVGDAVPILFAGRAARPTEIEAAGADEVMLRPAFLRDVVTIGRILRGKAPEQRQQLAGSLAETTGVFNLVRALSGLGRSAVLTLIRGLRRGEVRFFHGEVTSAQVGLIHGQAALHQLLLWTDARFDFHHEDIVRRQQIPLTPDELFADAERFLAGVRDESGALSPSMVLEQDIARIHSLGRMIPTEVHGVLRMFDGHRVLADILEDSPYRVFETLRVAQRAVEAGLLRPTENQRAKASWRAMLSIEEWLVGGESKDDAAARVANLAPATETAELPPVKKGKRPRKKRRANTPISLAAPKMDIDWGALVPRVVGAEVGPLAPVVPASVASGELASREPREKLEALMNTGARERMFASVILDEAVVDPAVKAKDEISTAKLGVEKGKTDEAAAEAARLERAAKETADQEKLDAEKLAAEKAEAERVAAEAKAAEEKAAAEKLAAEEKAAAEKAEAERVAAEQKAAEEKAAAEKAAAEKAAAEEKAEAERFIAEEKAKAEKAEAERIAAEEEAKIKAEAKAARERAEKRAAEEAEKADAANLQRVAAELHERNSAAVLAVADTLTTTPFKRPEPVQIATEGITIAETNSSRITVHEKIEVDNRGDTALVTATPVISVSPKVPTKAITPPVGVPVVAAAPVAAPEAPDAPDAPEAIDDEPSDGVIREMVTVETKPLPRPPAASEIVDDRPDDVEGEIAVGRSKSKNFEDQPSILVEGIASVTAAATAAPPAATKDIATPAIAAHVDAVRKDTAAFSADEEAFFKLHETGAAPRVELDEIDDKPYEDKPTFWERLLKRKPAKKP